MEEFLEVCDRYATRCKVEFNSEKSASIRFGPRVCGDIVFFIGGHPIPLEKSFTYLGFPIGEINEVYSYFEYETTIKKKRFHYHN